MPHSKISRCRSGFVALVAAGGLVLAACGGSPTATNTNKDGGSSASSAAQKLQAVYDKVGNDTDLQSRRTALIKLAKEEGGTLTWYTAANEDDVNAIKSAFEKATGIKINLYRAGSSTVRQRVEQEAAGGGIRADVINSTGSDPGILAKEGHFAELKSPITDELIPEAVFPTWFGDQVYPFAPAWNTKAIPPAKAPKNYNDLLTNFRNGDMVVEQTDADWLFGMVELLTENEGMTEDAALKLVGDAVRASTPFDGHTAMTELLAAGQFKISPDNYHYRVLSTEAKSKGKIAWSSTIGPIISEFGGTGIANGAAHPAAALLFAEYNMVDVQQTQWVKSARTPTLKNTKIGLFADPNATAFFIDYKKLILNITRYQKLFSDMLAATGKKVQTGD